MYVHVLFPVCAYKISLILDVGSGPDLIYDWVDFSSKGEILGKPQKKVSPLIARQLRGVCKA